MGRKIYLSLVFFIATITASLAQSGEIKGKVVDRQTKEPIPFATVTAELNGTVESGAQTDIDGKYSIKPLTPGTYNVKANYVGYNPSEITGVTVSVENFKTVDFNMDKGVELGPVEVIGYKNPLIDKGNTTTQTTITKDEIQNQAVRDINSLVSTTAGIYQQDQGGALNIRGSRSDATAYYVDGIKLSGSYTPPQSGMEQVTTITGGLPAQYGDATGGVINITTRGPSKEFQGGVELATSRLFDSYNTDLFSFNVSGPIVMKRDTGGRKSSALMGFFVAGEYDYSRDGSPSAIGNYVVNPTLLSSLTENPIIKSPTSSGFIQRADFVTFSDLDHINYHPNSAGNSVNMNGKIEIAPTNNVTITIGGSGYHGDRRAYVAFYELYNYDNNPEVINNSYHAYAKLTQKFGNYASGEKSTSPVKNAFYSIQLDYTDDNQLIQSPNLTDNFFDYGYVGKFKTYRAPFYTQTDTAHVNGNKVIAEEQTSVQDTLVTFTPSSINQAMANWTSQYYALAPSSFVVANGLETDYYRTLSDIPQEGGLINGDNRSVQSVYSLWGSPGRESDFGYQKSDNQQYRVTAQGSADIKNHSIVIGMEYEQRIDRGYSVAPTGLWTLARQLGNFNNQNLDFAHPHPVFNQQGAFENIINYDQLYVQKTVDGLPVNGFFENVRAKLGIPTNQLIDIDSYNPSTFSLNMFTPDELLNSGSSLVSYFGYDAYGNKTSGNVSINDFLNSKDAGNNYTRSIGAFQPNYVAGYVQDKFAFNDLNFNVGLRIDRYDANQPVLKDPYLLYSAHTAGELGKGGLISTNVPGNIPSSATVYVNDLYNPTTVVGYRAGTQFYDANGNAISDYSLISQSPITTTGTITPYLINPTDFKNQTIRADAFTQYTPQVNYMPRIAFSFPISDEALFYAHYDVLTQRPMAANQFSPTNYLFFESVAGGGISNPALQPERTTDYELGFKQALTRSSALSIEAFYKELRDMIEQVSIPGAFPVNYITYGNIDFGTVKGVTLSYDLRRTGDIRMTANYTLQFADGTGSNASSEANVIALGEPALRTPKPLDYDQRNTITTSIDYRYGEGKDYDGPMWFGKKFLENTGLNLVFRAGSGTPYTRQENITQDVVLGVAERSIIEGSINESRLPWNYRIDAKLDHDFTIKRGKKPSGEARKRVDCNVYFTVTNLLNTENVINVYRATGNPNDNGFLSSAAGQAAIANQVNAASYIDLFRIALNNPANYTLPRRFLFGVKFNLD